MSLDHSPSIVTDGLVLHLDAASPKSYPRTGASWYDRSSYNNVATIGSPVFNNSNYGNFVFSGNSGNYGTIPWNAAFPSGNAQRTISCTFKPTSTNQMEVFGMGNNSSPGNRIAIWCDNNVQVGIECLNAGISLNSSKWPGINNWCHLCAVVPVGATLCSQIKIYINGKNQIPDTIFNAATLLNTSTAAVTIATIPVYQAGYFFIGNIANIQVYNRALSDSEILQNFNAIKSRFSL